MQLDGEELLYRVFGLPEMPWYATIFCLYSASVVLNIIFYEPQKRALL